MNNPPTTTNDTSIPEDLSNRHEKLWTTPEVADFLHVSAKTVFNLRKKGLPCVHLGGAVRFVPQKIKEYLANSHGLSSHRLRQMLRKGVRS